VSVTTNRFKFRYVPIVLTAKQPTLPPDQVEVVDCQNVPVPPGAKLWVYTGSPAQLPASPLAEADWDAWFANFSKSHRLSGMKRISKSPDWQWVEIS
jgi:hypothetical protein